LSVGLLTQFDLSFPDRGDHIATMRRRAGTDKQLSQEIAQTKLSYPASDPR
jgi:hypothetical protein